MSSPETAARSMRSHYSRDAVGSIKRTWEGLKKSLPGRNHEVKMKLAHYRVSSYVNFWESFPYSLIFHVNIYIDV